MTRAVWRDAGLAVALAALAVSLHLIHWDRGFVLLDEGYVATIAALLARGGALYRDAVTYVLPGSYALLAALFGVAGESLLVARAATLALVAALVLASYRVARAALPPATAALGTALVAVLTAWSAPQWQVYGYQQPGVVAVVVAAAVLASRDASGRWPRALLAGLLAGAAVTTKQTNAVAAAALGLFVLADAWLAPGPRRDRRSPPLVAFAAGCAIPLLATFAVLAARGTLGDFWVQGVLSPLHGAGYAGYVGLPPLRPLLEQDEVLRSRLVHYLPPLLLELRLAAILESWAYRETPVVDLALKALFWLPIAVPVLAVVRLAARGRRARRLPGARAWPALRGGALLLALDLALLAATNRPLDWMHLALPWIGTALLGVWVLAPDERPRRGAAVALLVLLLVLIGPTLDLLLEQRRAASQPLDLPRAGVLARPADARVVESLVRSVQRSTREDEPILVVPYHPLVYFLAERPPASRFLFTWPVEYQAGRDAEMLAAVDRLGVRSVVHGVVPAPQLGTLGANAPALLDGLVERFRVAEIFGEEPWGIAFLRLEPRPALPEGTRLLEPSAGARIVTWPFERVVPLALVPGGAAEVRFELPPGSAGELVLSYGVNPDRWVAERSVPLVFEAIVERDGAVETLLSDRREPQARLADRAWPERRLPLDGRPGTLVLRVVAPGEAPAGADLAGWTVPRIEPSADAPHAG